MFYTHLEQSIAFFTQGSEIRSYIFRISKLFFTDANAHSSPYVHIFILLLLL